jgi:hypothetical protein
MRTCRLLNKIIIQDGMTHRGALKVHKIITNLEIYTDKVDEGDIITLQTMCKDKSSRASEIHTYISILVVLQAIISLIPMRKSPPVSR